MKTKFLLLVIMLFTVFGLAACKEATTLTTNVDVTEQVDAPTGLSISGKVLSWNAVSGVTIYRIYVNGVSTTTVRNATSYDFSNLSGDSIIFNVVAVAPTGYDDSPLSASIAYVANPAVVIAAINNIAATEGMEMPEGVVEELVAKGITGPIFQNDVDALQTMQSAMDESEGDLEAMNLALTAFVDDVTNYEAYISAFIKVMPQMIDEEIASLEENRAWYEDMLEDWPDNEYYQSQVDNYNNEIETLTALKAAIEENDEQIVITVMAVVNYLIEFHDLITNELIADIQALQDNPAATSAEIILVKDEVTQLLLDNLPSVDDLTLVFELLAVLENAINDTTSTITSDLANEYANAVHLTMEIVVRFIDSLDADFIDDMTALDDELLYTSVAADTERQILFLVAFHEFQAANQVLLDSVEAVFTEDQKQDAFEAMVSSYADLLVSQGMPEEQAAVFDEALAGLTYALAEAGIGVFDSMGQKAFDLLAASGGELLRRIAIQSNFAQDYDWDTYEYVYVNYYTGDEYDTYTAFDFEREIATFAMMDELVNLLNATVGTLTEAEFAAVADMFLALIPEDQLATQSGQTVLVVESLIGNLDAALSAQDQNVVALLGSLLDYLATEDVFGELQTLMTAVHEHELIAFGDDYRDDYEYDNAYAMYATMIFLAHHLDAWITATEETAIDAIVGEVFDFMADPDFLAVSGMTALEVTDLEDLFVQTIDELIAQAAVIGGYDYTSLSTDQQTDIQDFGAIIQDFTAAIDEMFPKEEEW